MPLHPQPVRALAALAAIGCLAGPALAQDDLDEALPAGPKQILVEIVGEDGPALEAIASADRSLEEWLVYLEEEAGQTDETARLILADYLSLNAPADVAGGAVADITAQLPRDGRELFVASCQACHGVASYYLLQDRTADEWIAIFEAPFHAQLLLEDGERETFASYAAHAMPMALDDIPPEWRD